MEFVEAINLIQNNSGKKITNGSMVLTWAVPDDHEGDSITCLCVMNANTLLHIMPLTSFFFDAWTEVH